MQFQCPKCSGVVRIDEANLGKTVSCGHCKEIVNAPADRFAPGVIINDFMIEKEVGVGGMGVVYLAKQITLDRPVALKILKEKYASDSEFIVQFVKEARAAAKLNHHSIVQAYAVGEEDGIFFFAMEFVDGRTMKEVLAEEKKIEPARAAKIIHDIAEALDYAWTESKIVHHDIKPDNIMLTQKNKAKLADLGLAGIFGEASSADDDDEVLGTPQYISPEQLLGDPTDVRSDIYSLGATFYHLVTGTFPYNGANATEIAHQHVHGTYEPPINREPSLPAAINDIIGKMMARNLNERYQSAADVAADIQKYLSDNGQLSTNTTASVPIQTPTGKFPSGGLKLSLNRDGAGAAKAKAAPAQTPAPAQTAAVPQNKPSVTLNKPAAVSGAVPKLNVPTLTNPNLPKATPNVTAVPPPKLGLKKEEEPAPKAKVPETPKEQSSDSGKNTEKKEKNKTSENSKNKKSADSAKPQKVKKSDDAPKRKIPYGLIFLAVIFLAAAGGVTYYLYKNNWKAPIIDKIAAWNKERAKYAKQTVHRIPVKPKKEPTIQELRKDYTTEAEKLKKFIADNPQDGKEFMEKFDNFNEKWGAPQLDNEHKPYAELLALYNEMDEKFWCAPARTPLTTAHRNEINRRVSQEKARKAEEARIQAARNAEAARIAAHQKAEAARIAAYRKAEAERRRKEAAEKQEAAKKIGEYNQKVTPFYAKITKLAAESFSDDRKYEELKENTENLYGDYRPEHSAQMVLFDNLKAYCDKLKKLVDDTRSAYKYFMNKDNFCSHISVLPGLGQVEIVDVDFKNHKVTVSSTLSLKKTVLSLKNNNRRKQIFNVFYEKISNWDKIGYMPFYYELFCGNVRNAAKLEAPSADWKDFFRYYR